MKTQMEGNTNRQWFLVLVYKLHDTATGDTTWFLKNIKGSTEPWKLSSYKTPTPNHSSHVSTYGTFSCGLFPFEHFRWLFPQSTRRHQFTVQLQCF